MEFRNPHTGLKYYWILVFSMLLGCAGTLSIQESDSSRTENKIHTEEDSISYSPLQQEDLENKIIRTPGFFSPEVPLLVNRVSLEMEDRSSNFSVEGIDSVLHIVSGYRVQIFAGQEQNLVQAMKRKIETTFQITTYLSFEAPLYKLRIGDYENRAEAIEFARTAKIEGFRDAWVVKTQVNIYR